MGVMNSTDAAIRQNNPGIRAVYYKADDPDKIGLITVNSQINPIDTRVTTDYIMPQNNVTVTPPTVMGASMSLPTGAFHPNLPATNTGTSPVTNSSGNAIPDWLKK